MQAPVAAHVTCAPRRVRFETPFDVSARESLLDRVMGPERVLKTSERLRQGQAPAAAFVVGDAQGLLGTVRLWNVRACGLGSAWLLGPLAVDARAQGLGLGASLVTAAIDAARTRQVSAVLLVGDPGYYERFGFAARGARRLAMPGPFERHRLLGLAFTPGALDHAHGVLKPGHPAFSQIPSARAA